MSKCNWPIDSTQSLGFEIYDFNTTWNSVAGLYIFTYQATDGHWYALYVGQTDDFSIRLPNHESKSEAIRRGATHVHALVVSQQKDRDYYEEKLVQYLQPPMNKQLKNVSNY
jgi:predicted GIY-YIG superfamily endonuclease